MQLIVGLFLVVVLVWVSVSVSADLDSDPQIFVGKEAKDGQFPYHIGLYVNLPGYDENILFFNCGGSLISETFILTAAHCIEEFEPGDIKVFLGSIYLERGIERRGRKKIIHNMYELDPPINDIGLLEIDSISYSDTIKKINLPPFSDLNMTYEGHLGVISGWGDTNASQITPDILQYTKLLVISNTACDKTYIPGAVTQDILCAADPDGSAICAGDSGGPLVDLRSQNLIGIVSFVPAVDCNTIHFGSAFTRVTSYRHWIYNQTGI